MSAEDSTWLPAIAASLAMVFLGVRLRLLTLPELKTRCGACGRLVWRGRTCPCARR